MSRRQLILSIIDNFGLQAFTIAVYGAFQFVKIHACLSYRIGQLVASIPPVNIWVV